jgi:hypothetical protein
MANNMKRDKPSIKIIKREERDRASRPLPASAVKEKGANDGSGKASRTVSGWVSDFQRKRRLERQRALATLR